MDKQLGKEGKLKLELSNGQVAVKAGYEGKGLGAELSVFADTDYFCDELAKLIPGDTMVEQFIMGALKTAFKAAKV